MKSPVLARLALSTLSILGLATSAYAGPVLICHAIEIGQAKSLPWVDWTQKDWTQKDWTQKARRGYDLKNLTPDTLAILDADTPVLVHMETLRRATIYARQDPQVAKELLTRLQARAANADASGHPQALAQALAWFDVGYLAETYKQWIGKGEPNPAVGLDGYGLIKKAISLRGQDPEMEFAAALITFKSPQNDRRDHAQKATEGAKSDPLLAQNLASDFYGRIFSELLTTASARELNQ
jgi:hypothetical protein